MNKYLILLLLSFMAVLVYTSVKPPLPNPDKKTFALENLDITLRARNVTIVDELQERLEDFRLTRQEQEELKALHDKQEAIVDAYKNFYLILIAQYQEEPFNKLQLISDAIRGYRTVILEKINTELQEDCQQQEEKIISRINKPIMKPMMLPVRRQREEDEEK